MNEKHLAAIRRHDLLPLVFLFCIRWWVHSVGIALHGLARMCWIGRSMKTLLMSMKDFVITEPSFYLSGITH